MRCVNGGERERVRAEIILAIAIADGQRRAEPGADHQIGMVAEQEGEREGAVEARQHRRDRLLRRLRRARARAATRWATTSVSVWLSNCAAFGDQLLAQRLEILDDAVVDQRDAADDVRVGIADGRRAVGRPAGMGDADDARQRLGRELAREIVELALGAAALEPRRRSIVQMPAQS